MYTYLYNFAEGRDDSGQELYLAWVGWVCVWTALLLFLLAEFNACTVINRFRRIAGELFGLLISVLSKHLLMIRLQGVVSEFQVPEHQEAKSEKYQFQWLYTNGLLGIIFSLGLLYTALKSRKARSWWYGTGKGYEVQGSRFKVDNVINNQIAGYGKDPSITHLCCIYSSCDDCGTLPFLPQYHLTKMVESAKESIKQKASDSDIYSKMPAVFIKMDKSPETAVIKELEDLKKVVMKDISGTWPSIVFPGISSRKECYFSSLHLASDTSMQHSLLASSTLILTINTLLFLCCINDPNLYGVGTCSCFIRGVNTVPIYHDIYTLLNEADVVEKFDAELLDELTTSREELKLRTVSFSDEQKGQVYPKDIVEEE
ncbi:hypothetical protein J1N35_029809 [Gossypium stocksii]|uniref:Uncharacterized protein n=1 Tax=Gossypium stocksii TaxID=47602 RepID=A0A9D3ZTJ0_9ROSI|nr:hypothetical protein J1N35_029809 [Gossypium stocksii]